ncbi:tetratricopeptide (TPR) repeat protein [Aquibacillus albus]|uniref:Tetratricopeptide (TPR) repeat protein n=2 Tax=Aquibacillus albus TaxID=1168171 RepID=A0ABS2N1P5_9BACI|nr:tetratricopeptide repeat protein [Aquibacillus albus]MBM7571998.1 tetratricopeptide (TPR) repeat protein [Aquibacillus albus]
MFPKWQKSLEKDSKQAIEEKRYKDALYLLNQLIEYDKTSHDLWIGKLICLMELGEMEQAEDLCQDLVTKEDAFYYEYVHIYSTILFQTGQYELLIELLLEIIEQDDLPESMEQQFQQMLEVSKSLKEDKKSEQALRYINHLKRAVIEKDDVVQWRIIEKCKHVSIQPYVHELQQLLVDQAIHPVVKTAIIERFLEQQVEEEVEISKYNQTMKIKPSELRKVNSDYSSVNILGLLEDVEQENPTLFDLIKKLCQHYLYVVYPFTPNEEAYPKISKALEILGYQYLQIERTINEQDEVNKYIIEIIECNKEYSSIIED